MKSSNEPTRRDRDLKNLLKKNDDLRKEVDRLQHELEVSQDMLERLKNENSRYKMKLKTVQEAIGSEVNESNKTVRKLFEEHLDSLR